MRHVLPRLSLLAMLCILLGAGPAAAHASLVSTDPPDGSSRATSPTIITFTFNEEIANPAYVAVRAPDGSRVTVSGVKAVDGTVRATLAPTDQKGRYFASYRVVSADAHPVEGSIEWTTTSGRSVKQVDSEGEQGFLERNRAHLFWGILAAAVAIALLLAPLRRSDD